MTERDLLRLRLGALSTLSVMALAACSGGGAPGECGAYTNTPGTAHIISVETAPAGAFNCANDPVEVLFDFTPTDPLLASRAASGVALTIGSGENPPNAWVVASGLIVGSDHPAVRSDQPVGPCPPIVWKLTALDDASGLAACN